MKDKVLSCFKAYDVRGKLGSEIDDQLAYKIGYAVAKILRVKKIVVGHDARESSPSLSSALIQGILDYGADVLFIGLSGTEEVYAASSSLKADAGIEVTASHNPIDYNGFKIVKSNSQPLTDQEFSSVRSMVTNFNFKKQNNKAECINVKSKAKSLYIDKILTFVNLANLKPLKIVINSGNGAAGPTIDKLCEVLKDKGVKFNFIKVQHNPDPTFPNGVPNPLLEENRNITSDFVRSEKADFGVAFDGDFDRCFLFDHLGNFVPGEYMVGILARFFLGKEQQAKIVHDSRVIWNTQDIVKIFGGNAVSTKTGHAFVKAVMRDKMAIYGGEISAHHYFRDFYYCDSGMIPWLIVWELLSKKNLVLSDIIADRTNKFLSSGELNFDILNPHSCLLKVKDRFALEALEIDEIDGLSVKFEDWRFNLRKSNTEPLVRLNLETRGDAKLLKQKTQEIKNIIVNCET